MTVTPIKNSFEFWMKSIRMAMDERTLFWCAIHWRHLALIFYGIHWLAFKKKRSGFHRLSKNIESIFSSVNMIQTQLFILSQNSNRETDCFIILVNWLEWSYLATVNGIFKLPKKLAEIIDGVIVIKFWKQILQLIFTQVNVLRKAHIFFKFRESDHRPKRE